MSLITTRKQSESVMKRIRDNNVSMAIFCTASHWNTEAILIAADRFAKKHEISEIPVSVAMTFNYHNMPQSQRVTRSKDAIVGFKSIMEHLRILCGIKDSPYASICVMPHLDHADPERDRWALTEGLPYLSSVMFDAQRFSFEQNMEMTAKYVQDYGKDVLVEGIVDVLSVSGKQNGKGGGNYAQKALEYYISTKVDFIVADLGTEQQSQNVGQAKYLKYRANEVTHALNKKMLVLHGTSCLSNKQINGLADDGITRVNLWTRIAREAGQFAAENLMKRYEKIQAGDFEATESMQYMYDNIDKAAEIMEEMLDLLGYRNLACNSSQNH